MLKGMDEMIDIAQETNILLCKTNKIITITNIINAITIVCLILVLVLR